MPRESREYGREYYTEGRHRDPGRDAAAVRQSYEGTRQRDADRQRDPERSRDPESRVDPEFDARYYRDVKLKQEKALEKQRLAKELEKRERQQQGVPASEKEQGEYDYELTKDQHRRMKHKKKKKRRKLDQDDNRIKGKKPLVEYDDVSSGSEVYSDSNSSSQTQHSRHGHKGHRTNKSRVSSPSDKSKRAQSPSSAILEYKKELMSRSHSNSPASVTRGDKSPHYTSSAKSRKSHSRQVPDSPPPKGHAPKVYAEPPKAYRAGADSSPSSSRRRRNQHEQPASPHSKKYSSPASPHR